MPDVDSPTLDSTEPTRKPQPRLVLVGIALILPMLSGVLLCFVPTVAFAIGISAATVILTAALVAIDAKRLGRIDLKGRQRESAGLLFVGMCLMWIVVYPVAFFRRSAFGSPNLGFVSLFVALFFASGPYFASLLIPTPLPLCTSGEVAQVLEQVIRSAPVGSIVTSIEGHRELNYDPIASVRLGECVAHTDSGDIPVRFMVEWQDRAKGLFQVRLSEPELPLCTTSHVARILEQVIRSTPVGATVKSIDGHREVGYNRGATVRRGECVAHTDSGDIPVRFIVEWKDREKGLFQVRIPDSPD
jgi:hypothetical protein